MSNQQVLERSISKAIDGGWDYEYAGRIGDVPFAPEEVAEWLADSDYWRPEFYIFNHDFAKALWGEEQLWFGGEAELPAWQYHLAYMVIAPDPISYLAANI